MSSIAEQEARMLAKVLIWYSKGESEESVDQIKRVHPELSRDQIKRILDEAATN